jgi:hypothetical protein
MQTTMVLEHHIFIRILDSQLGVQGMEYICELWNRLVPFLLQCGPSCIQVIITSNRVVLFLDPGGYRWPPTFSDWLKTVFWQFWQFTIFSRFLTSGAILRAQMKVFRDQGSQ